MIAEALDTNAQSVHRRARQLKDFVIRQVIRIGLERYFCIAVNRVKFADSVEYAVDVVSGKQRGCSTTEIDSLDGFTLQVFRTRLGFAHQGLHHFIHRLRLCREMKVTVVAGLSAKRDMEIDAGHNAKVPSFA